MIDVVGGHVLFHLTDCVEHEWITFIIAIHALAQVHFLINFVLVVGELGGDYRVKWSQINVIEQIWSLIGVLEGCLDVLQSLHLK